MLLFLTITSLSCSASIQPLQVRDLGYSRTFVKNYTVGQTKSAYVGEEIVKIKDYYVHKRQIDKMQATNDFTIIPANYRGSKDDQFNLVGVTESSGQFCYVMQVPGPYQFDGFLITSDGYFTGEKKRLDGRRVTYVGTTSIVPKNTKFRVVEKEEVDINKGFINYEIVYTGRDKDSLKFIYREFTPNDIARPAFYQNLTYDIRSKYIRFKNYRIEVVDANDEKITYTVLEDGYKTQ